VASKPVYNLADDIYMPNNILFEMCIFYCDIGTGRDNNKNIDLVGFYLWDLNGYLPLNSFSNQIKR